MKAILTKCQTALLVLILLGIAQKAFSIDERYVAKPLRGNQIRKDSFSLVKDSVYFDPSLRNVQTTYLVRNLITFRIDEFANLKLPDLFEISIKFKVYYIRNVGGNDVQDSTAEITLNIKYDKNNVYDAKAIYTFKGGYESKVVLRDVIVTSGVLADFQNSLLIENEILINREYSFSCTNNAVDTVGNADSSSNKGELKVYWSKERPADEYDLEWTYIDSSALSNYKLATDTTIFDPRKIFTDNATRVSITREYYYIPLLYDNKGHLFFRVRAVQVKPNGQRIESTWSSNYPQGLGKFDYNGHEPMLNWQATTSFAEEGKRKSVVQYFDGSLRNRQTVTKDNTTDSTIVAETFYDYQGRPVIQVLPTPSLSGLIKFTPNFNGSINLPEYEKDLYDGAWSDSCYCSLGAPPMDSSRGAARYYSAQNPNKNNGFNKYIPDAQKYPYTETRYTADNTGRVSIQSGVGLAFQIGKKDADNNTHETKYFYGSADQEELDALFGTEVGKSSHYFKNMVRDANGQYSVSYVDMHGRTIATALAGLPRAKLDTLSSYTARTLTKKLLDSNNNIVKGLAIESSRGLLITKAGNNRFVYSLLPDSISIKDCNNSNVCYDCKYDLEITITDECNNTSFPGNAPVVITRSNVSGADILCNAITAFPGIDTTIYLKEGNYLVTKKLVISKTQLDYYRDSVFMVRNACKTLQQFIQEQKDSLRNKILCEPTCSSCIDSIGTWQVFRPKFIMEQLGIPASDTALYREQALNAYNQRLSECEELCKTSALSSDFRNQMLADLTPPFGQYANRYNIDEYSIFRTEGIGGTSRLYQNDGLVYLDENGKRDVVDLGNGILKEPRQLTIDEFVDNFKPSWAGSLLPLHPEYCRLQQFESLKASHLWDQRFGSTETFKSAVDSGYLNPANFGGLPNTSMYTYYPQRRDPLFTDLAPTYKAQMLDSLNNKAVTQSDIVNAWSLATIMAYCKGTDQSCLTTYKPIANAFTLDTSCAGDLDMAWRYFREMYLQEKREIVYKIISNTSCLVPNLAAKGYFVHFRDPRVMPEGLPINLQAGNDSLLNFVNANCEGYATQWWEELKPCNFTADDSARIVSRLIKICQEGGDANHPFGSSTVKPSSTYNFRSFEQFLKHYADSVGKPYNATCNVYLISAPGSFEKKPVYTVKPVYTKPDTCECNAISSYYVRYTSEKLVGESFSQFVYRTTTVTISDGALDTLRQVCNGQINCNFLKSPIVLPAIFQCGAGDVCVTCAQFAEAYNSFKAEFPGIYPSRNGEDSLQNRHNSLFMDYLNERLGFAKDESEYLDFMDSCGLGIYLNPSSFCDSLQFVLDSFRVTNSSNGELAAPTNCQFEFKTFYNTLRSTNFTYHQLDSIYFSRCNIRLNVCGPDPIYNCDTLSALRDSAIDYWYTPHYDSTGCDTTYWVINYGGQQIGAPGSSTHDVPAPLGHIFKNGIAHIPDSVQHPANVDHLDWDHKKTYCFPENFNMEARVKIPDSSVTRFSNFTFVIVNHGHVVKIAFTHRQNLAAVQENYGNWSNYTIDSAYSFNNYRTLRLEFRKDSVKVYCDGRFLFKHKILRSLTAMTYLTLQTWSLKPYFDYYKIIAQNGDTILHQGYDNCNSAVYNNAYVSVYGPNAGSVLARKFFNPRFGTAYSDNNIDSIYNRVCGAPAGISLANCLVPCDSLNKYYSDYKASKQADSCLGNLVCAKARFVNYINNRLGVPVTYTQLLSLYANCGIEINPLATTTAKLLCGRTEPVFPPTVVEQHSPCDDSTSFATWKGTLLYENYRDSLLGSFDDKYIAKCLKARYIENFTVTQDISEFHYTLYYYDQAGNLLKTVPPAGVDLSKFGVSNWSDQVKTARANKTVLTPSHTLATNYRYNTLNQVVAQNSPDGGTSEFWYDRLGRLAISRNAKQKADTVTSLYSYTKYDYLGRISEVGQIKNTVLADTIKDATSRNPSLLNTWLTSRDSLRGQITQTVYDLPYGLFIGLGADRLIIKQRNLRNRVSYVLYQDSGHIPAYSAATFYTYDIHGNVDTLLQDYGISNSYPNLMNKNGDGNRWKKIAYKYDLISGKVNMVLYQPGWGDQWLHRYSYDAENRLTLVETSRDSLVWERDARYEYYRHGPLARMTIGDQLVQGVDYAYTLQGWLKGVNSTGATATHDMGGDGRNSGDVLNRYTARDAYSYSLNYFAGDYAPINTNVNPFPGSSAYLNTAYRPLYNGNISSMVSNIRKMSDPSMVGGPILLYNYKYDQLNRLTAMDTYNGWVEAGNSWTGGSAAQPSFNERIAYDGNGNILKYLRNANTYNNGNVMDSLTYKYYAGTNRLRRVTDRDTTFDALWGSNSWEYNIDLDHQTDTSNYKYDAIGNLISDSKEGITSIRWSVYGKILEINRAASAKNPVTKIVYKYDPQGNRIGKIISRADTSARFHTWYVRDAQGNILSTYTSNGSATDANLQNLIINQTEKYIYGSSRLGVYTWYEPVDGAPYDMQYFNFVSSTFKRGWRQYELTNHLGNVLVTVSDKKFGVALPSSSLIDYYEPDVVAAQDYFPFGMLMPRRSFSSASAYKFGFNGKENDNEVKGLGNQQDYGMRIYDGRVGRFLSVDPITNDYPELTPYQFASNRPIDGIDMDGLEYLPPMKHDKDGNWIPDGDAALKNNTAIANIISQKHQQGMSNVRVAERARQQAIKQGRKNGDGITWWTKAMVYIAPFWNSAAMFSDANDGAVLLEGKNLDGSEATKSDYIAAGVGLFIPFVSGGTVKNIFKGFSTSVEGYKYGGKTFKNAEQFEKALVSAGTYQDKVAMIESVIRDVAKTNNWKKSGDLSKKTGREFYDLGNGTFGSIDKQHGHIEVFKKEGKKLQHQGSINIDGVRNKQRNESYDITL